MKPIRFVVSFALYVFAVGMIAYAIDLNTAKSVLAPKFWFFFSFLAILTLSAYLFSWIGIRRGAKESVFILLGSMIFKLLLSASFALFYITKIQADKVIFVLNFIILYLLFSVFEMWAVLFNLRHPNKSK